MSGIRFRLGLVGRLLLGASIVVSLLAIGTGTASAHSIVCSFHPQVPVQLSTGGPISAKATIICTPDPPDVSSTTIRIWRHDFGRNQFYLFSEYTTNYRARKWTIEVAPHGCAASIRYGFHTEVINQSYHGNWFKTDVNSGEVIGYC